jgi:hypothetical protein
MNGILYIEETAVEATTGHMLVTFKSGGDGFRFHLPAHVALRFRQAVMQDAWQVCCAPDAKIVTLQPKRKSRAKAKQE